MKNLEVGDRVQIRKTKSVPISYRGKTATIRQVNQNPSFPKDILVSLDMDNIVSSKQHLRRVFHSHEVILL